jgi:hypothetical protein
MKSGITLLMNVPFQPARQHQYLAKNMMMAEISSLPFKPRNVRASDSTF